MQVDVNDMSGSDLGRDTFFSNLKWALLHKPASQYPDLNRTHVPSALAQTQPTCAGSLPLGLRCALVQLYTCQHSGWSRDSSGVTVLRLKLPSSLLANAGGATNNSVINYSHPAFYVRC
jgi:hypothetical protein